MFIRLNLALCLCLLALPVWAKPNTTTSAKCGSLQESESEPCVFTLKGKSFRIQTNGKGVRSDGQTTRFSLNVPGRDVISVLYYGSYGDDIILVYETEDGESSASYVVRLDGQSLSPKWETHLEGFNTASGLIDAGFLYQTAIGLVAKLDLETGSFVWIHKNLYDRAYFSFNSFETPEKNGGKIVFREVLQTGVAYDEPRSVVVSDAEGVIRVEKPVFK
ncbi:MAG: hypothetical protein OEZ68_12850 [Gammaproteobacteria bacterium]|nr:hypothetical protein [Gammaproteobacteria bacterium]MDH5801686.1 hypothetical protein [Gammaproteobacteria bacterium]